jgi:hypothetical protein
VSSHSLFKNFFYLFSDARGRVLPSGHNTMVARDVSAVPVDWLSGCSMSYRRRAFDLESFDESRTPCVLKGMG